MATKRLDPKAKAESVESLGRAIDRIDSLVGALQLPAQPAIHVAAMKKLLPDIARELKEHYVGVVGEDPWDRAWKK